MIDKSQLVVVSVTGLGDFIPLRDLTKQMYQQAFAGYPWFENLSDEEVFRRLDTQSSYPGFGGTWLINDD